jgi:hypothetical protein
VGDVLNAEEEDVVIDVCSTGDISISGDVLMLSLLWQLHLCTSNDAGYSIYSTVLTVTTYKAMIENNFSHNHLLNQSLITSVRVDQMK